MIDGDCGGDCTDRSSIGASGGECADFGRPAELNPTDEGPKINGASVIDQSHQIVIPSAKSQEARKL
jgi:hypothetical protein